MALIQKINLKKNDYKNSSAWVTIYVENFSDAKDLDFRMNSKLPLKMLGFVDTNYQEQEKSNISVIFPLDQKDIDGEKYILVIRNTSKKSLVMFKFRDTHLPSIGLSWEGYYSEIKKYRKM